MQPVIIEIEDDAHIEMVVEKIAVDYPRVSLRDEYGVLFDYRSVQNTRCLAIINNRLLSVDINHNAMKCYDVVSSSDFLKFKIEKSFGIDAMYLNCSNELLRSVLNAVI